MLVDLRHAIERWLLRRRLTELAELASGTLRAVRDERGEWSVALAAKSPAVDWTRTASGDDLRSALWFLGLDLVVPPTPATGWRRLLVWFRYPGG